MIRTITGWKFAPGRDLACWFKRGGTAPTLTLLPQGEGQYGVLRQLGRMIIRPYIWHNGFQEATVLRSTHGVAVEDADVGTLSFGGDGGAVGLVLGP